MAWQLTRRNVLPISRLATVPSVQLSSSAVTQSSVKTMSNKDSPPQIRKSWFQPAFPVEKLTQ